MPGRPCAPCPPSVPFVLPLAAASRLERRGRRYCWAGAETGARAMDKAGRSVKPPTAPVGEMVRWVPVSIRHCRGAPLLEAQSGATKLEARACPTFCGRLEVGWFGKSCAMKPAKPAAARAKGATEGAGRNHGREVPVRVWRGRGGRGRSSGGRRRQRRPQRRARQERGGGRRVGQGQCPAQEEGQEEGRCEGRCRLHGGASGVSRAGVLWSGRASRGRAATTPRCTAGAGTRAGVAAGATAGADAGAAWLDLPGCRRRDAPYAPGWGWARRGAAVPGSRRRGVSCWGVSCRTDVRDGGVRHCHPCPAHCHP
jgi:hypothetical protein